MPNTENLNRALLELEILKETDSEAYAAGLLQINKSLQNYNEKVAALIEKLAS